MACVTFAEPPLLRGLKRELERERGPELLGVELYGDPERAAYRAFGFARGSIARVWLHPRVILRYGQLLGRGRRVRAPRQDTLQLGGDVLVTAAGRVAWVYASAGPEDRPSLDDLRAARPAA